MAEGPTSKSMFFGFWKDVVGVNVFLGRNGPKGLVEAVVHDFCLESCPLKMEAVIDHGDRLESFSEYRGMELNIDVGRPGCREYVFREKNELGLFSGQVGDTAINQYAAQNGCSMGCDAVCLFVIVDPVIG